MSLWGNLDHVSGNQKPLFANTSNATSSSTIHGSAANTKKFYGKTMGVSATEMAAHSGKTQHAGWVSVKYGTGPIKSIEITDAGDVSEAGFIELTDTSAHGLGAGANISYTVNTTTNTVTSVTINDGGSGWSNSSEISYTLTGESETDPTLVFTLGGRGDRLQTETLIAMGSIRGDDPKDNVVFSGV